MRTVIVVVAMAVAAVGQAATGLWVGTAQRAAGEGAVPPVPFEMLVSRGARGLAAAFINGPERTAAYSAELRGRQLTVKVGDYANTLTAVIRGDALTGTFGGHARPMAVSARRVPDIGGAWQVQVHSPKGESAWAMRVMQSGTGVSAVIQRIDGDTGRLYGSFRDGSFELHRFNGSGGSTLMLQPMEDGTMRVGRWIARRPAAARSAGLAGPDDPFTHTRMQDPRQPLRFRFRDLAGDWVANTDARFRGKVVIVAIGGSWCPNCHDEAPLLEQLYSRYHTRGLDVVYLDFEDAPQLANPTRLRAFIGEYHLTFPVLLAGRTDQLEALLPQVASLNCWPTTFFVGRGGLVKRIHAGFASAATGEAHQRLVADTNVLVQRLLGGR